MSSRIIEEDQLIETPGYLARRPGVGFSIFLLSGLLFGLLWFNVKTNGPLTTWDQPIDQALHARATHDAPLVVDVMRFTSQIGQDIAATIITFFVIVWLVNRYWYRLAMLLIGVSGGTLWFLFLSNLIGRHRPIWPDPLETLPGPGFPSGHSITSMLLYGLLLYLVWPYLKSNGWKVLAVVDVVLLILLIGFSRLYIGSHFPTDVLAGYAFGLCWGSLIFTCVEVFRNRRAFQEKKTIRMPTS